MRRLAPYIEESLYQRSKWVNFEPNDELLWSQIRLSFGAFMTNLFRWGFAPLKPGEFGLIHIQQTAGRVGG